MLALFITAACVGFLFAFVGFCIRLFETVIETDFGVGSFIMTMGAIFGFISSAIAIGLLLYDKIEPIVRV